MKGLVPFAGKLAVLLLCMPFVAAGEAVLASDKAMDRLVKTENLAKTEDRDCDCLAKGQNWRQGAEICLNGKLHVCGMEQNVSSWISRGRSCPTS